MKYLYKEDFSDFSITEFPYDHDHSALGEYHTFELDGYKGNFYDPISLHQYRSKGGNWLITSDGLKNYMEQNRADEASGAFINVYSLLMLKNKIYAPYVIDTKLVLFNLSKGAGITFLYHTSRNLYALLFKDKEISLIKREDENFITINKITYDVLPLKEYEIKIEVHKNEVLIYLNKEFLFKANIEFRIGLVGLMAKDCTRYYYLNVSLTDKYYNIHQTLLNLENEKLKNKQAQYVGLKCIKKINLGDFGSGRQLRIARYNNKVYFLLAQNQKRVMRDSFARLSCLTCFDIDGNILWQKGKACNDFDHTMISCDLPFQVTDFNNDNKLEVIYSMDFKIYVVDLLTGKVLKEGLPPIIYNDPLVLNEPFYYLNLDGLRVADFRGQGYQGDLVVKDRYQNVYALDDNFKIMWRYHHKNTGHFPFIYDINNDGYDEMLVGYDLVSHDGKILWSLPYNSDHTDEIIYGPLTDDDKRYFILASGNEGMNIATIDGKIYKHNEIGHAQRISLAKYNDNIEGYQIITTAFWGSPGITRCYDKDANVIAEKEFITNGNLVSPVLYDGINILCLLNASPEGGLMDSDLDIVVKFPNDNHPYLCSEVFDIDADGIDEIICWDQKEMWIYKAERYVKSVNKYEKYPDNAFSNYRGEYLILKKENKNGKN